MPNITKPSHGAPDWDTAVNSAIDDINAVTARSSARRYLGTTQTAIAGGLVTVALDTTDYTVGSRLNLSATNGIQVLDAGLYLVTADVFFNSGSNNVRNLLLVVGSTTVREIDPNPGTSVSLSLTAQLSLSANDTITIQVYTGGGPDITSGKAKTGLAVTRIG